MLYLNTCVPSGKVIACPVVEISIGDGINAFAPGDGSNGVKVAVTDWVDEEE